MDIIKEIVDQSLTKMSQEKRQMKVTGHIPEEMLDPSIETSNDSKGWKPIKSIVNDNDLDNLENKIGHKLPPSYREFLKYKHFIDLTIPNNWVNFPNHLPDKTVNFLLELVFNYMVPEQIIGKGYIYFADFMDYGILCFNTNEENENNEYPIVYIDNYDLGEIHLYANNFIEVLEEDENKGANFFDYICSLDN